VPSPTERTLKYLRDRGYHPEVVEKWIPGARIRKDLWGFVDVLALGQDEPRLLAIQCTSASNVAARCNKIADSDLIQLVRGTGIAIYVYGWAKGKPEPRIVDLS